MQNDDLTSLYDLLKTDGERVLHSRSKLSLSTSLLHKVNAKLASLMPYGLICSYEHMQNNISEAVDLQMLYNVVEQTLALKLFNDCNRLTGLADSGLIDLHFFRNIKLLEVQRLSVNLLKGLKALRSQLKFVTCSRSVETLKDVLELCGADRTQGYVWSELKEAVFSHNYLHTLDASLEFAPVLEYLDLSYNLIGNIENVNYLMNLKHLNLANNKIEVLPKFTGCAKLQTLILRNNYIEELTNLDCLVNLELLDISCNCLIYFETLQPLNFLKRLKKLHLQGNPMSYHKTYRNTVCTYLSVNKVFTLDGKALNAAEMKVIDSMPKVDVVMESSGSYQSIFDATVILAEGRGHLLSSGSFQSCTTTNTVIEAVKRYEQTSDMEVSQTSVETRAEPKHRQFDAIRTLECGMQDSGIVAGHQRPASPTDSIGSATSIHDDECLQITSMKRYSESDISILSNPSQSSIEVLSDNTPKCVQSTIVLSNNLSAMCPDEELKKVGEEMHRSL